MSKSRRRRRLINLVIDALSTADCLALQVFAEHLESLPEFGRRPTMEEVLSWAIVIASVSLGLIEPSGGIRLVYAQRPSLDPSPQ